MYHVGIIGTGSYVPDQVLTNHDLQRMVDTSDEWIVERTGIRERRIAGEEESNVTMGCLALTRAIEKARIEPEEIDMLLVGTNTTLPVFPSAAGHIAKLNGLRKNIPFFDVQAGCTGFNYALSIAEQFVKSGQQRTVAVVGADKLSLITDYSDRNTCVLFSDGAGAVVVQRRSEEGIIRSHLGGDYQHRDSLVLRKNGDNGARHVWMDGKRIFAFAKRAMTECCLRILDPEGNAGEETVGGLLCEVDKIIPHQANARIIQSAAEDIESKLDLSPGTVMDKMIITIGKYGNNSTASIPLALDESLREGQIKKGNLLILVAFGAGLTYAANLVRL